MIKSYCTILQSREYFVQISIFVSHKLEWHVYRDAEKPGYSAPMQNEFYQQSRKLSDSELISKMKTWVKEETRLTSEILWLLKVIYERRLHLKLGFGSIFEYLTQGLNYSEGSASRRVAAMKLLADIPEVVEGLKSGELTLSTVSQVQGFFKAQAKEAVHYSPQAKKEKIAAIRGKSSRETERLIAAWAPQAVRPDSQRAISEEATEIKFTADAELLELIERFKNLTAHQDTDPRLCEVFKRSLKLALKQIDPRERLEKKKTRSISAGSKTTKVSLLGK